MESDLSNTLIIEAASFILRIRTKCPIVAFGSICIVNEVVDGTRF